MRLSGRILGFVLLLSALALVGTSSTATAAKSKPPTVKWLFGKQFESVNIKGNKLLKGKTLRLSFVKPDKNKQPTMRISGGCNYLGANFRLRHGRLASRGLFSGTKMACKPDPDPWIRNKFKAGLRARVVGQRLVLARPAEGVRMVFRQSTNKKSPAVVINPAVGSPATVESLNGKSFESTNVIGRKLARPIELAFQRGKVNRFDEHNKQVEGNSMSAYLGCNWMGGEYKIEDDILSWSGVMSTLIGCRDNNDGWFHDLVRDGVTATQDGNTLTFTTSDTQVIFKETS